MPKGLKFDDPSDIIMKLVYVVLRIYRVHIVDHWNMNM